MSLAFRRLPIILLAVLALCSSVHAASGYVAVKGLARQYAMEYRDLSSARLHACKLVTKRHYVIVTCGSRNLLIDGSLTRLSQPVLWEGESILVPAEAAGIFAKLAGREPVFSPRTLAHESAPQFAPASFVTSERKPGVVRSFKIVIDPGHGGRQPGAVYGGIKEKDINLDIARRLVGYLKAKGVTVVSTRQKDVTVSLSQRVRIANRHQPDLFLSIHANAEVSRKQHGAMSLHPAEGPPSGKPDLLGRAKEAVEKRTFQVGKLGAGGGVSKPALLAVAGASFGSYRVQSIYAARDIQNALVPVTGCAKTRNGDGIVEDYRGLRLLCLVQAPAVLAEVDFLSNTASRRKLRTPAYRDAIARAIASAVVAFRDNGGRK